MKVGCRLLLGAFFTIFSLNTLAQDGQIQNGAAKACAAPLFAGLGTHSYPITTTNQLSQKYFDQGLKLAYAFNHAEAEKSFLKAAEIDPTCAMCYWGAAYVLGPTINSPMDTADAPKAYAAVQNAIKNLDHVTKKEQALIKAMSARYAVEAPADRSTLDREYAEAMERVTKMYPNDADVLTLSAEAWMDTTPWRYWGVDRKPKPVTVKFLKALTRAMEIDAMHPGANHFYIHGVEAVRPELAEASADRVVNMLPAAGHLIHMASHIYIRVGRYHDASLVNQKAIAADEKYLKGCHVKSMYEAMYIPHNRDFLVAAAYFEGRSALALKNAKELQYYIAPHLGHMPAMHDLQHFQANYLWALLRFGRWKEILQEKEPADSLPYVKTLWHNARVIAFIRLNDLSSAEEEFRKLEVSAKKPVLESIIIMGLNKASDIVSIGVKEASGELAAAKGDYESAVRELKEAIAIQDRLIYVEPPSWYHSVRLALGEVLISAGKIESARKVFEQDLKEYPDNGWALYGLYKTYQLAGKRTEAADTLERFKQAWKYADVKIKSARF